MRAFCEHVWLENIFAQAERHPIALSDVRHLEANGLIATGSVNEFAIVVSAHQSVLNNIITYDNGYCGLELAYNCEDVVINNYVSYNDKHGLTLKKCKKVTVKNYVYYIPGDTQWTSPVGVYHLAAAENVVEDFTLDGFIIDMNGISGGRGIVLDDSPRKRITIRNGIIKNCGLYGGQAYHSETTGEGLLLENVHFYNLNLDGATGQFCFRTWMKNSRIKNCIFDPVQTNVSYALHIRSGADNSDIFENDFRGSYTAGVIYIEAGVTGYRIKRNRGYVTENSGVATFSGDGSTTQFAIPHGLVSEPTGVYVTPLSADAAGDFYVTKDSTYIYVNYLSPPPSGTDNVVLSWRAEV